MLFPENTQQVCDIIRRARETGTGLVALSSQPPHFHGASENAEAETVCLQVSRGKKAGPYHLMLGQNPVYIFTLQGGDKA